MALTFFLCACLHAQDTDTDIIISVKRSTVEPVGLMAAFVTTRIYPCEGYTMRGKVSHERDTITVAIEGLVRPNPCISSGYAAGSCFIGNKAGGTYILRFMYRGIADLYRLSFVNRQHHLTPIRTSFTLLEKP